MSITLLCLVKGNTTANAFAVDIDREKLVSHLKEDIIVKIEVPFGFKAKDLKLWKVNVPDDRDDLLSNLSDYSILLATKKISRYFPDSPVEEHIHVLVEPPATTQRRILAPVRTISNKYAFDVTIVSHKRTKSFKWTVSSVQATLEGLKNSIREKYQPSSLENDTEAILKFISDGERYSPRNEADFRKILQLFISKNNLKFTVFIETPSKPFIEWTFPTVCELYCLSDDPNPSIDVYPVFSCGSAELNNEESKAVVKHLMTELNLRKKTTPIDMAYKASKSIYSYCYLASGVSLYEKIFKIIPKKLVKGNHGQGNLDFAIECRSTGRIAVFVDVKKDDFKRGFAQATVQMESSLTCRKRKADEIDDECDMDKVWAIITDAEKWYFMECTFDEERNPSFKLSEPVVVVYDDENMEYMVRKVLSHIVWLLEEAQKPVLTATISNEREIKRTKSTIDPISPYLF